MSASNTFETALLQHILQNAAIANVGDASGLQPSATAGSLYVSLHTADPGETGAGAEANYTGYARQGVARSGAGWDVSGAVGSNAADINFPEATGGSSNCTHFGIWTAATSGTLLLYGPLDAALAVSTGIAPIIDAGELTITVD